jgi:hypothetical protein
MKKSLHSSIGKFAALLAGALSLASVVTPQAAHADGVPLSQGDVLAATGSGRVRHFNPSGSLLDTLNTTSGSNFTTGMCFNSSGDLFVTNISELTISEFDPQGNLLKATWATVPTSPESCTVDAADHMYVGGPSSPTIYEYDSTGTKVNEFTVKGGSGTVGTDWLDLAADQCTILYTGEGKEILSYNVCTQTQNPDVTTSLPAPCFELRIRPNGQVMVACASAVILLDTSGNILQAYPVSDALFSMNLDADSTTFWTGDSTTGEVFHVDIASGAVLGSFATSPSTSLLGLSIVGGIVVSQPTLTLTPPAATSTVGTPDTVTATVTNPGGSVSSQAVSFAVTGANTASGSAMTAADGQATFTYTGTNAGMDTITARFTNDHGATATGVASVTWVPPVANGTTLTVSSGTGDFADLTAVSAMLTSSGGPVSGKTVTFTLNGAETCSGTTDATGAATCLITPGESAGTYSLAGSFAGDATNLGSNGTASFKVTHEETALAYNGPQTAINGQPFTLSGQLTTDDPTLDTALAGKTVTFTLGTASGAQTCSATTDSTGSATCSIPSVSQPIASSVPIAASFAGDDFYVPATATSSAAVFEPREQGAFVIGDTSAGGASGPTIGTPVSFWGSHWAHSNSFSGGPAPSAMKGFVDDSAALGCGSTWTTRTGNSSVPPTKISQQIEVIVSSSIDQTGSTIQGDVAHIVIVQVDPGYGPAPGHPGTGKIIAVLC